MGEPIEGREKVVWAGSPINAAIKAWRPVLTWNLQLQGEEVQVAREDAWAHVGDTENLALIVHGLDHHRTEVRTAHAKLVEMHDGRMGEHEDLPLLALDASLEGLEALLVAEGSYKFNKTPVHIAKPDPEFSYPTPTPRPTPTEAERAARATSTPIPPFELTAENILTDDGFAVRLAWNPPVTTETILGWRVYRTGPVESLYVSGEYVTGGQDQVSGPGLTHVDEFRLKPGTTYKYVVYALRAKNRVSVSSYPVEITTPSE